jgi:hypothetical protein
MTTEEMREELIALVAANLLGLDPAALTEGEEAEILLWVRDHRSALELAAEEPAR